MAKTASKENKKANLWKDLENVDLLQQIDWVNQEVEQLMSRLHASVHIPPSFGVQICLVLPTSGLRLHLLS